MKRWFWVGIAALFVIMSVVFLFDLLRSQPAAGISPEQKKEIKELFGNLRKIREEISSIQPEYISSDINRQKSKWDWALSSERPAESQADIKTDSIDYAGVGSESVPIVSEKAEDTKYEAKKRSAETLEKVKIDMTTAVSDAARIDKSGDGTKSGMNLNAFAGALIGIIGALSSLLHVWRSDRRENKRLEMEMLRLKMELKKTACNQI